MSSTLTLGRVRPLGKGEYDPAVAYEAMTIVMYDGTAYWAIVDVPAGQLPEITGTAYWLPIGFRGEQGPASEGATVPNASTTQHGVVRFALDSEITAENTLLVPNAAQLYSIYFRVATAEGRITNNATAITAAQSSVSANTTAITAAQSSISTNATAITALQTAVGDVSTALLSIIGEAV